jgi:hypothetical protein
VPIYSEQTLAERALRKLMVIADGQSASASDVALVSDKIEGMLQELVLNDTYPAASVEAIQAAAFDHIASLLAEKCSDEFGVVGSVLTMLQRRKVQAEYALRAMTSPDAPANEKVGSYM